MRVIPGKIRSHLAFACDDFNDALSQASGGLNKILSYILVLAASLGTGLPTFAAGGRFPKMPPGREVWWVDCTHDTLPAIMTTYALEGLINQSRAEVYVVSRGQDSEQLRDCGRTQTRVPVLGGPDSGLRSLFKKFPGRVKKMFIYDPDKDWTFCLALMASAQQEGIPVEESVKTRLTEEFAWKGEVEDFRTRWPNRVQAYNWALANLMPHCSRKVLFAIMPGKPSIIDYVVASQGFLFCLDVKKPEEKALAERIFATKGYTAGTSLMGYGHDSLNTTANPYGIGYVVSDFYCNGSFWSSFPNKIYRQSGGKARVAEPGKIYVALTFSDGDNISFDAHATYLLWHDPARGQIPVATTLSPSLQELNSPLLDWYYTNMSAQDELIAGPSGFQFIYGKDYNKRLLPEWCKLNREWMADAGFHNACLWHTEYPSRQYTTYLKTCGLTGIFLGFNKIGVRFDSGTAVVDGGPTSMSEDKLYRSLAKHRPDRKAPVFISNACGVGAFMEGKDGGYTKVKRVIEHLQKAYPGRYVFMLPKDFFATIRAHYHFTS